VCSITPSFAHLLDYSLLQSSIHEFTFSLCKQQNLHSVKYQPAESGTTITLKRREHLLASALFNGAAGA
jgi:hypothetical protein